MEAAAAIVASSTVSCSIGAPIGTNWGSRAVKNAAAFGLRRLLTRPWAKESPRNQDRGAAAGTAWGSRRAACHRRRQPSAPR